MIFFFFEKWETKLFFLGFLFFIFLLHTKNHKIIHLNVFIANENWDLTLTNIE